MKNQPLYRRVRFALAGVAAGWRREANFRIEIAAAAVALAVLLAFRPAALWWAIVALTVSVVLAVELVNAALEAIIDRMHPDEHPAIRTAKDIAAAAVLIAAVGAACVGVALLVAVLRDG